MYTSTTRAARHNNSIPYSTVRKTPFMRDNPTRPAFFTGLVTAVILVAILLPGTVQAQFYYNGRGPMDMKWRQIKSPHYKLIYPDYFAPTATAMAGFLDSIAPGITHGFTKKPQRLPIILHTENLRSNGEVAWAPKRMELMTTAPAGDIYADPWLKQLAVHESRHVVQLSALRSGITRLASWLFGQAGTCVGMLVVPKWFLEGDATLAETQYSEFGRGWQPSFTVGMRALFAADSNNVKLRTDKWTSGSYRHYVPGIYEFGYQLVSAGERYYGPEMWGRTVEYAGRWPIFIVPMRIYLKRHYDTHISDLTRRALTDLDEHWKPYSAVPDSYTTLTTPVPKSYTTYQDPITYTGGILAAKSDYNTPVRFISIDTTAMLGSKARERTLAWIAPPSSRPILDENTLYWTEFKPHPIWEYKTYSVVRSLNLATGKRNAYGHKKANYFVTPLTAPDGVKLLATISPDSLGGSDLVLHDATLQELDRMRFDALTTLHGMAWDSTTRTLAFITLGRQGMHLQSSTISSQCTFGPLHNITEPSMTAVSGLRADGRGRLYFSSIQSGKDEIHAIDLIGGSEPVEQRLTTSRFGAYAPAPDGDSTVLLTTYTNDGYLIAKASSVRTCGDTVTWSRLPENLLNLPAPAWNVPAMTNIPMNDTVTTHKIRRYNKALRWFNVHSWAPISADVVDLLDERSVNVGFGATLFFQSVMGDSYGSATYGRLHKDNWLQGSWTYAGLPVQIGLNVEYGGGKQSIYIQADDQEAGVTAPDGLKSYLQATADLSLPLNFSGGRSFRLLQPSFSVTHYNARLYDSQSGTFDNGYQKYKASLWWSESRRASVRSVVPRLGYALRADVTGAFSRRFGMTYSLYARGYLPGFMKNHSITLRAAGMVQTDAEFGFNQKPLFPRGGNNRWAAKRYGAASFDYTFPLVYPDGGINNVIYFKRIWLNLFGDYARGDYFAAGDRTRGITHYSYGGDIAFDLNVVGSTSPVTIKVTLAAPNDDKFYVGFGFSINL